MVGGVVECCHMTGAGEGVARQFIVEILIVDVDPIDGLSYVILGKQQVVGRNDGHARMPLRVVHLVVTHGEQIGVVIDMVYQHAMTFLSQVVANVLDVLDDEILAAAVVVVVENTVGRAFVIDRFEFEVLVVDEGGYFYPLKSLTLPCCHGYWLIAIDEVVATIHQAPVFHGLVVAFHRLSLLSCGVEIGHAHGMAELMAEGAYAVDALPGGRTPASRKTIEFGTYGISRHRLAVVISTCDCSRLWPDTIGGVAAHRFRIAGIEDDHQVDLSVVVGIIL